MSTFYPAYVFVFAVVIGTVLTAIFSWLNRKRGFQSCKSVAVLFFAAIGLWFISVVVATLLLNPVLRKMQASEALPYIQDALDDECGQNRYTATEDGFNFSSTYEWSSDAASCYFNNAQWICTC